MKEQDDARPGSNYFPQRIDQIIANMRDPLWRHQQYIFYQNTDPESKRRGQLPKLNVNYDDVLYDPETGKVYTRGWQQTKKAGPAYEQLGFYPSNRDLNLNPPKSRILERRVIREYDDIEAALKGSTEIRDKYRLLPADSETENDEAAQMLATLERVSALRRELISFPDLTEEDLTRIIDQNTEFLITHGYGQPELREKLKIRDHLAKGFTDRTGRKNPLAAHVRLFAIELNLRKRLDLAFPAIFTKYSTMVGVLTFERDRARLTVAEAADRLDEVRALPIFSDPNFPRQRAIWEETRHNFSWDLQRASALLTVLTRVKPYKTPETDLVAITLGADRGTQAQAKERGITTVKDYLDRMDSQPAAVLMEQGSLALRQVIERTKLAA